MELYEQVTEPKVSDLVNIRGNQNKNEISCETCDANGPNCDCSDPGTGSDSCACEDN